MPLRRQAFTIRRLAGLAAAGAAVWIASSHPTSAFLSRHWTFPDRLEESDIVVVAKLLATRDTGRHTELLELRPPYPAVEMTTDLQVLSVFKGGPVPAVIRLQHYRHDPSARVGGLNGPGLISFASHAPAIRECRAGDVSPRLPSPCYFLLYLRQMAVGLYAPVSGQIAPGDAVFLLRPQ